MLQVAWLSAHPRRCTPRLPRRCACPRDSGALPASGGPANTGTDRPSSGSGSENRSARRHRCPHVCPTGRMCRVMGGWPCRRSASPGAHRGVPRPFASGPRTRRRSCSGNAPAAEGPAENSPGPLGRRPRHAAPDHGQISGRTGTRRAPSRAVLHQPAHRRMPVRRAQQTSKAGHRPPRGRRSRMLHPAPARVVSAESHGSSAALSRGRDVSRRITDPYPTGPPIAST